MKRFVEGEDRTRRGPQGDQGADAQPPQLEGRGLIRIWLDRQFAAGLASCVALARATAT